MENNITDLICYTINKEKCNELTKIFAHNILQVSSKRVFEYPAKFIIELITNSLDSYKELKGKKTVGKFGLGFISTFYFIQNPDDYIKIITCKDNKYTEVIIRLINGEYKYSLTEKDRKMDNFTIITVNSDTLKKNYLPSLLDYINLFTKTRLIKHTSYNKLSDLINVRKGEIVSIL